MNNRYFKVVDDDGYIKSVGIDFLSEEIDDEISELDYIRIVEAYNSHSDIYGQTYKLNNETMELEAFDIAVPDDKEISDDDAIKIIIGDM